MGVVLEANGAIMEDAWLQLENDARHINLAELDATLKKARLTTKASSEMLIWRRMTMLAETNKEYNLVVDVTVIRSVMNLPSLASVRYVCHKGLLRFGGIVKRIFCWFLTFSLKRRVESTTSTTATRMTTPAALTIMTVVGIVT